MNYPYYDETLEATISLCPNCKTEFSCDCEFCTESCNKEYKTLEGF